MEYLLEIDEIGSQLNHTDENERCVLEKETCSPEKDSCVDRQILRKQPL